MGTMWIKCIDERERRASEDDEVEKKFCAGCGKQIEQHVVREFKEHKFFYYCSFRCYQKPVELQAIKF